MSYKTFDDWMYEIENYSTRLERAHGDSDSVKWAKTAWEIQQEKIDTLEALLAEATEGLDYYEEVLLLRKKVNRYETIFKHAMAERTGAYFICGETGEKDSMGLPQKIMICPTHGLDGTVIYKKENDYSAPSW